MRFCLDVSLVCAFGATYLAGSLPFGFWFGKYFGAGRDVRQEGSGNIGATNVLRTCGRLPAVLTLVCDALKGLLPVILAQKIWPESPEVWAFLAVVAVFGHVFSCFLGFRGGKGVATSLGVLIPLSPVGSLILVAFWGGIFWRTRMSSLASLATLCGMPFVFLLLAPMPVVWGSGVLSILMLWTHQSNIKRLIKGEELTFKKKD